MPYRPENRLHEWPAPKNDSGWQQKAEQTVQVLHGRVLGRAEFAITWESKEDTGAHNKPEGGFRHP
jgi:uncharacterized lipoprotein YmbA